MEELFLANANHRLVRLHWGIEEGDLLSRQKLISWVSSVRGNKLQQVNKKFDIAKSFNSQKVLECLFGLSNDSLGLMDWFAS